MTKATPGNDFKAKSIVGVTIYCRDKVCVFCK